MPKLIFMSFLLMNLAMPAWAKTTTQEIERAQQLNNQAVDLYSQGKYQAAILLLQESLEIRYMVLGPIHTSTFASINLLAFLYETSGQYEKALPLYQRTLSISEKSRDPIIRAGMPVSIENLARLYLALGQYEQALPLYRQTLKLEEKSFGEEHSLVTQSIRNLAELYLVLGQHEKAIALFERSLTIEEKNDPVSFNTASSLSGLADTYQNLGQLEKALPLYQRLLDLRKKILDPSNAASINNLAVVYVALGQYEQALPLYQSALSIHEAQEDIDPANTATSLSNLGGLYVTLGKYDEALPLYQRAYRITLASRMPDALRLAQVNLGNLYTKQGNVSAAIFYLKGAVNTMQGIRSEARDMEKILQKSLLKKNENVYTQLADLLISAGRLAEAQHVLSMLKEEEYFDFIRRDTNADARSTRMSYSGAERSFTDRLGKLGNDGTALVYQLNVLNKQAKAGLTPEQEQQRARIKTQLAEQTKQTIALLNDLAQQLPTAQKPQLLEVGKENLNQFRTTLTSLGHGAVLLQYIVTEKRVHIILTTPQIQIARAADISAKELNRKIAEFRRVLQNPTLDPRPQGQELYQLLIAPVENDLKRVNAHTLMLSLDGSLRYLPMSALYDGKNYLAERYPLAIYTEVAKDNLNTKPDVLWKVAGLGLTQKIGEYKPLPSVKQELAGIVKGKFWEGAEGILPGDIYLNQDFTQSRLHEVLDRDYSVLHIASHFVFIPGTEAQSFLLLGDGKQLSLADIRTGGWKFNSVDLMTLSACETGLGGGKDANGREIEGFGVLAQRQGAKGVLATLWPVADQSTAILMQELYRSRQEKHLTKVEALRDSQLALINGTHKLSKVKTLPAVKNASAPSTPTFTPAPTKPYAHPYYWAPFILMGNWL